MTKWEAYEAYTTGNRKEIGWSRFELWTEPLNDGSRREYISGFANDGNHYIFRPNHPQYEEIRSQSVSIQDYEEE